MIPNNKIFKRPNSTHKLLVSASLAVIVFACLLYTAIKLLTSIMIAWDCFAFVMVVISWITFFTTSSEKLSKHAKEEDENMPVTFMIVLVCVCFSLFGTLLLMVNKNSELITKNVHTIVSLLGVALSWCLLQTLFTGRYAHLYYGGKHNDANKGSGLSFPGERQPDYLDFAYFSFVIGMTFQVSDVEIDQQKIRRFALLHGLIAFVFNTIIVALTINLLASLR